MGGIGVIAAIETITPTRERGCTRIDSPDHDLPGHPRMNRAEVLVSAGRVEAVRELLIRVEHRRLELLLEADDVVRHVVAVGPGDRGSHRHPRHRGREAEVIDDNARALSSVPHPHSGYTDQGGMCANTTIGVLLFSRFTSFSSHSSCSLPSVPSPPAFRSTTFTRPAKWTPPWSKLCQPAPLVPLPNRCR